MEVTESQFLLSGLFADRDTTWQNQKRLLKSDRNGVRDNVRAHFLRVSSINADALLS